MRPQAAIRSVLVRCNDPLGCGRTGASQLPNDRFELVRRLDDRQRARIDHRQAQGIRLATEVRRPMIHAGIGELGLLSRATQARGSNIRGTVEQHDVCSPRRRASRSAEDETRSRLPVQDGHADVLGKAAEPRKPIGSGRRLPAFTTTVVALHNLGSRHTDRIEVEAFDAGNGASVERADSRCFAGPRGASHDEYIANGQDHLLGSASRREHVPH
jgi:hypothetical protein